MPDLVKAKESYWAGDHLVELGTVMAATDPRVKEPFVEAFNPALPTDDPPAGDAAAAARRSRGRA